MDTTKRLRVKRRSCKASITKLLAKLENATLCDLSTINPEVVTGSQRLAFPTTLTQLKSKLDTISKLSDDISETIQNEEELETELTDADMYMAELEEKTVIIEEFIKKAGQHPVPQEDDAHTLTPHNSSTKGPETDVVKKPIHSEAADGMITDSTHVSDDSYCSNPLINTNTQVRDTPLTFSRLPKLTLPTFTASPLEWQTFWDSFTAGVDSNLNLTNTQKFAYLRVQIKGDAACIMAGFPMTDNYYLPAVTLLRERFGQRYKIIDAYMEALLNVPLPLNTLNSLQSFHDTIQSHKRSLSALGKSPDTYGTLLTSVILSKLPHDTKARMARDHYNTEWTLDEIMDSILKEIHIFEAASHSGRRTSSMATTSSFHMSTYKARERLKKEPTCVFCKGTHKPNLCTVISSPK